MQLLRDNLVSDVLELAERLLIFAQTLWTSSDADPAGEQPAPAAASTESKEPAAAEQPAAAEPEKSAE